MKHQQPSDPARFQVEQIMGESLERPTILIIDDEEQVRNLVHTAELNAPAAEVFNPSVLSEREAFH